MSTTWTSRDRGAPLQSGTKPSPLPPPFSTLPRPLPSPRLPRGRMQFIIFYLFVFTDECHVFAFLDFQFSCSFEVHFVFRIRVFQFPLFIFRMIVTASFEFVACRYCRFSSLSRVDMYVIRSFGLSQMLNGENPFGMYVIRRFGLSQMLNGESPSDIYVIRFCWSRANAERRKPVWHVCYMFVWFLANVERRKPV